jgi:hypothetical protein
MKLNKYTRYFLFTRVNPKESDYALLVATCERIDAFLGYQVLHDSEGVVRLSGFVVLRGPRTFVGDLCLLFPNFNFTPMSDVYELGGVNFDSFPDGTFLLGEHPFVKLRRSLFS